MENFQDAVLFALAKIMGQQEVCLQNQAAIMSLLGGDKEKAIDLERQSHERAEVYMQRHFSQLFSLLQMPGDNLVNSMSDNTTSDKSGLSNLTIDDLLNGL